MTRGFIIGATIATGVIMLVPGVARALAQAGKPLTRAGLKTGAYAYKEFQKAGAEVYEHIEDLAAEFRSELDAQDREADETGAETDPDGSEHWQAEVKDNEDVVPRASSKAHD
jgi:hypothetical protein